MKISESNTKCSGFKFEVTSDEGAIIGRAFLYVMYNGLHKRPFGLLEDVFINNEFRGSGVGTVLIEQIINKAVKMNCYKLLATSRHARSRVHELYVKIGFTDYGKEFRMSL